MKKAPEGTILILVLVFTVILSIFGFAVIYICGQEEIFSNKEIVDSRVLYLADAGIEAAKGWLVAQNPKFPENVNSSYGGNFPPWTPNIPMPSDGSTGSAAFTITTSSMNNVNLNDPSKSGCGKYTISSTGKITGSLFTWTQNVSLTVFISTAAIGLRYSILPNSWVENPVQRN